MAPAGSVPVIYGAVLYKSRQRAAPRQLPPPGPAGTPGCPSYLLSDAEPSGQRPSRGEWKNLHLFHPPLQLFFHPHRLVGAEGWVGALRGLGQVEGGWIHLYPPPSALLCFLEGPQGGEPHPQKAQPSFHGHILHPESPKPALGDLQHMLSPEGQGRQGCGATGRASAGEQERVGKGAFSPQCAEQIGTSSG